MQTDILAALQARRSQVRLRWEQRLRRTPATSPLANPTTLAFMMDWTLDRVFEALATSAEATPGPAAHCPCGLNPLLGYFAVLEEVLRAELRRLSAADCGQVRQALGTVADREIAAFCAVCQRRPALAQALAPACSQSR